MCLSKNIRYLRLKKNFSQEYVANKLGYKSYTTIQKWESGVSEPPVAKLRLLADLLGVDINDIATKDIEAIEKNGYYINPDTAAAAQEMYNDPDHQFLSEMQRNMDPKKYRAHMDFMREMYRQEHPEYDEGC